MEVIQPSLATLLADPLVRLTEFLVQDVRDGLPVFRAVAVHDLPEYAVLERAPRGLRERFLLYPVLPLVQALAFGPPGDKSRDVLPVLRGQAADVSLGCLAELVHGELEQFQLLAGPVPLDVVDRVHVQHHEPLVDPVCFLLCDQVAAHHRSVVPVARDFFVG